MAQEVLRLLEKLITPAIIVVIILAIVWFLKRFVRFQGLLRSCRKLCTHYNGTLTVLHSPLISVFRRAKDANVRMQFGDKTVDVQFRFLKPKTTVRIIDSKTIEFTQYRRSIGLQGNNKGLTPSYRVMGAKGIEEDPLISQKPIYFTAPDHVVKLLLFTSNPSIILVYDPDRKNNLTIGDGELAHGYHVGGYNYLDNWLARI